MWRLLIVAFALPGVDPYSGPGGKRELYCADSIGEIADCKAEHDYEWRTWEEMAAGKNWLKDRARRCVAQWPANCEKTSDGPNLPCLMLGRDGQWSRNETWCREEGGALTVEWGADGRVVRASCAFPR